MGNETGNFFCIMYFFYNNNSRHKRPFSFTRAQRVLYHDFNWDPSYVSFLFARDVSATSELREETSLVSELVYCIEDQASVTLCPKSSNPFYIVTYGIKWVTTSWTYSIYIDLYT